MYQSILVLALTVISFAGISQEEGNYILVINNDSILINLDGTVDYKTPKGEALSIQLTQSDIQTYSDEMISFRHDKSLNVSNTMIEEGIEQCMILRSTGNGFMVQKYETFDPTGFVDIMVNELTKESVNYGYTKSEKPFKIKLRSGQTLEGVQATLKYKGEKEIYTVATYGEKDEGVLVVTMLLNDDFQEDKKIIDLFLETLEVKL
ncbi:MAG: hypothetical protein HWE22_00430 [Flavobacteriales bacterium]|nr:hypothetical protein [Flavobacteriales bacterium]